ncbi:hypothetical protein HMI55_003334 [Coelomomyces lativittatus]|nr:hypothetical protein HMI55_003334 [Coelomomyces lativittatus]
MSSSPSSVPELESSPPPPPLSAPSFNHFNFLNPSQSSSEKFISSSSTLHSDSFFMPAPPTLSSPFVPTIHDPFYSSNKNEIPMPNSYGSSKFEPTLPSLFPVVKEGSSASSSHPNFQFSSFFYDSTNELSHQLSTVQLGHHRNSKKDMLGVHINLNLNAIADNKLPSPSMNSIPYSSSPSSSLLPTKQNSNVYVPSPLNPTTNESTMHTNASFSHPNLNNPQLSSPDQIPRHKTYFNKFTKVC